MIELTVKDLKLLAKMIEVRSRHENLRPSVFVEAYTDQNGERCIVFNQLSVDSPKIERQYKYTE